jgi:hypothetical protein
MERSLVQPAVNSLGANAGTVGIFKALAARLSQLLMSSVEGRRVAAGCASRSSDETPPRHLGAAGRV